MSLNVFFTRLLANTKIREFIRFVIVGVLATVIHYGIYLLLLHYMHTNVSYTIGYVISFICNFFMSNFFTFKSKPTIKKGVGFGISHVINYMLHITLLNLFIFLGLSEKIAPVFVFAIVIPINFMLVRFVFKSEKI